MIVIGDVICVHNERVYHARSAFQTTVDDERVLAGAYIDMDEMRSRRRILELELGL